MGGVRERDRLLSQAEGQLSKLRLLLLELPSAHERPHRFYATGANAV